MRICGVIYLLENSFMKNVVKIGRTSELYKRLSDINSGAGVIGEWSVVTVWESEDIYSDESKVHKHFRDFKIEDGRQRELFAMPVDAALNMIDEVLSPSGKQKIRDPFYGVEVKDVFHLGQEFKRIRKARNLTISDLKDVAGMRTISDFENGKRSIGVEKMLDLAEKLKIQIVIKY